MSPTHRIKSALLSKITSSVLIGLLLLGVQSAYADGVSQRFTGSSSIENTLSKVLPIINYSTDNLSDEALQANAAKWQAGKSDNKAVMTRVQALLNWHNHSVGALDGYWGMNTRHAMQAFQEANNLPITNNMNEETWQALISDDQLANLPVLVNYTVQDSDINIKTTNIPATAEAKSQLEGMYYESVAEGLAEKFHLDISYLRALNPNVNMDALQADQKIIVYNPGMPNTIAVNEVIVDKAKSTLFAYDDNGRLVASYPTTVGSASTPSPSGIHDVKVKVYEPNYTYTHDDGNKFIIPPGPNNPVGNVWIGLSKPSYGIHGSPEPERISRQASAGCIRLTNWDALALYGTIKRGASVALTD